MCLKCVGVGGIQDVLVRVLIFDSLFLDLQTSLALRT